MKKSALVFTLSFVVLFSGPSPQPTFASSQGKSSCLATALKSLLSPLARKSETMVIPLQGVDETLPDAIPIRPKFRWFQSARSEIKQAAAREKLLSKSKSLLDQPIANPGSKIRFLKPLTLYDFAVIDHGIAIQADSNSSKFAESMKAAFKQIHYLGSLWVDADGTLHIHGLSKGGDIAQLLKANWGITKVVVHPFVKEGMIAKRWNAARKYYAAIRLAGPKRAIIRPRVGLEIPYSGPMKGPARALEDKLLGSRMTFTAPVKSLIWNTLIFAPGILDTQLRKRRKEDVLHSVQSDYRYARLHEELATGKISKDQAAKEAQKVNDQIEAFDRDILDPKIRAGLQSDPLSVFVAFRSDPEVGPLFERLDPMIKNHVFQLAEENKGFRYATGVTPPRSITAAQAVSIYSLETQKLEVFPKIRVWFAKPGEEPKDLSSDPAAKDIYESIRNSAFNKALEELLASHRITQDQYMYALMQDYDRQILFQQYRILGVEPLQPGNSAVPLTLAGERRETLQRLATVEH